VFTEAVAFFKKCMVDDPGMSTAVAAIQTLLEFMNQNAGKLELLYSCTSEKKTALVTSRSEHTENCPLHIEDILHGGAKILFFFIFEW